MQEWVKIKLLDNSLKYCPVCERFLDKSEFHKNKSKSDGLNYCCKECKSKKSKILNDSKPIYEGNPYLNTSSRYCPSCKQYLPRTEFDLNRRDPEGLQCYCKTCKSNKMKIINQNKELYEGDPYLDTSPKECLRCHKQLNRSEFYKNYKKSDGLEIYCKECEKDKRLKRILNEEEYEEYYRKSNLFAR